MNRCVSEPETIVIGGGISGLTTAWRLKQAGRDVCLLEADDQVGGVMRTRRQGGFLLEQGPFNVIVRDSKFQQLLEEFEDEIQVIAAERSAGRKRYVLRDERLLRVPGGPLELLTTKLLTTSGKVRLMRGLLISRPGVSDETIAAAATRRFGPEVADRLISAFCVGVFAAESDELSLRACFPTIASGDRRVRSPLLEALVRSVRPRREKKEPKRRRYRGLVSFRDGLGTLPEAIAGRLGAAVRTGCRVNRIEPYRNGYNVICTSPRGAGQQLRAPRLVLAVDRRTTGELLRPFAADVAGLLNEIESSSLTVMNLGFERGAIEHPLDGFGFLVPRSEAEFPLLGVLWADSVFPHHAPPDCRLLRIFLGGSRHPRTIEWSDDELLEATLDALRSLLGISGTPRRVDIRRWPHAVPRYGLGHGERIERVRVRLREYPGLHLVGNYLSGVSVNDCIRVGAAVAEEILAGDVLATDTSDAMPISEDKVVTL